MSDQTEAHRHEWHISESGSPYHDVDAGCRHCNARLTEEEVNARLNGWEAVKAREEAYQELIYAVETKHESETRHQTALRYIREAELHPLSGPFVVASEPPGEKKP